MDAHLGISIRLVRPMHLQTGEGEYRTGQARQGRQGDRPRQASEHAPISPRPLTRLVSRGIHTSAGYCYCRDHARDGIPLSVRAAGPGSGVFPSRAPAKAQGDALDTVSRLPAICRRRQRCSLAVPPGDPSSPLVPLRGALAWPRALEPPLAPWLTSLGFQLPGRPVGGTQAMHVVVA